MRRNPPSKMTFIFDRVERRDEMQSLLGAGATHVQ